MNYTWPNELPVTQIRVARPTGQLKEIERFYCEGVGLRKIGSFEKHNGYDGIMIGLPGYSYHLEFTQHEAGSPCPAPTNDNLLVFYIPDKRSMQTIVERLAQMGYPEVASENPYWQQQSAATIADPDGWRLVLIPTAGIDQQ
jgi:hypothetical protein